MESTHAILILSGVAGLSRWNHSEWPSSALAAKIASFIANRTADYRARLRPPLPAAFFGNCAKACYARAAVGGLRDAPGGEALARASAAVREAFREQLVDPLGDAERWTERRRALPPGRVLQVGASNRFAAYVAVVGAPDGAEQRSFRRHQDPSRSGVQLEDFREAPLGSSLRWRRRRHPDKSSSETIEKFQYLRF